MSSTPKEVLVCGKTGHYSESVCLMSQAHYNIVMGDFNAKVGAGEIGETCTGSYGIGTRNRRGDMLVEFAEQHKFKIMNTFFKKRLNR